ncbi:hypothetical protein OIDMADRAFT_184840 [Oidiodendron maius Zn]|uniref:Uncharacterized protein n=1 Tax=Oidiodendron maius (strain Zn) TaxID=913774 RepID=A0A0C3GAA1_OIDMZ|nr:hypothetical protein OIDMADRAFT_184840 [Oidiodendron maius Zn]
MSSLQRETFKNLAVKEKLKNYGNWLKAKVFKDHFSGVQIRDDKETMELLTPVVEEIYGEAKSYECQVLRIVKTTYITSSKPASIIPIRTISAPWRCGESPEDLAELAVGDKVEFEKRILVEAGIDLILARRH